MPTPVDAACQKLSEFTRLRDSRTIAQLQLAAETRPLVEGVVNEISEAIPDLLDRNEAAIAELRAQRDDATDEEASRIETLLATGAENVDVLERRYLDNLSDREALGLESASGKRHLSNRVLRRAAPIPGAARHAGSTPGPGSRRPTSVTLGRRREGLGWPSAGTPSGESSSSSWASDPATRSCSPSPSGCCAIPATRARGGS